jgi:hypothetical protein
MNGGKMSLYEISEQIQALDQLLANLGGDVTEGTDGATIEKWAEEYQWMEREKVDGYVKLIKNIEGQQGAIDDEVKALTEKSRVLDNRISRLKSLVKFIMDQRKTKRLEGNVWSFVIQKNGGKDPIELLVEDPEKLPDEMVKIIRKADLDAIREALEAKKPEALAVARIGERGESLRIR